MPRTKPAPDPDVPPAAPAAQPVAVADLQLLPKYQCRLKVDPALVRTYATAMQSGAQFPSITVANVNGAPCVVDGWHRVHAAREIGRPTIEAVVHKASEREAMRMAALANTTHGARLKKPEVVAAFKLFIKSRGHVKPDGRYMSYRELSLAMGGYPRHTTLHNWMKEYFPKTAAKMGGVDISTRDQEEPDGSEEDGLLQALRENLHQAATAARGIQDPRRRGEAVHFAEKALAVIRDGGPWEPAYDEFDRPMGVDF